LSGISEIHQAFGQTTKLFKHNFISKIGDVVLSVFVRAVSLNTLYPIPNHKQKTTNIPLIRKSFFIIKVKEIKNRGKIFPFYPIHIT
jgi:hypothetical protein